MGFIIDIKAKTSKEGGQIFCPPASEHIELTDYSAVILILQHEPSEVSSVVRAVETCEEMTRAPLVNDLQPRPFNWLHELLSEPRLAS